MSRVYKYKGEEFEVSAPEDCQVSVTAKGLSREVEVYGLTQFWAHEEKPLRSTFVEALNEHTGDVDGRGRGSEKGPLQRDGELLRESRSRLAKYVIPQRLLLAGLAGRRAGSAACTEKSRRGVYPRPARSGRGPTGPGARLGGPRTSGGHHRTPPCSHQECCPATGECTRVLLACP